MEILLVHLGTPCECFVASSVIKGLKKKYKEEHPLNIYTITKDQTTNSVFKYNNCVRLSYPINKVPNEFKSKEFDLLINLSPDFKESNHFVINSKEKLGFNYTEEAEKTKVFMYESKKTTKNIFQMYFILARLKWKGEGYSFYYHPKHKNRRDRTGLYIVHNNLLDYISSKLKLDLSKTWAVPQHKNIFKRLDELNKCSHIVTDDFFTLNLALFLRKRVIFLETIPFNYKLELFNCGKIFKVPRNIFQ